MWLGLGGALVVAVVAARLLLLIVTVEGDSMRPALAPGDRLLVLRGKAWIRPGRVAVLKTPNLPAGLPMEYIVKRVAAVPGQRVPDVARHAVGEDVVPAGRLVVLGDAAHASADSRMWGFARLDSVVGISAGRLS